MSETTIDGEHLGRGEFCERHFSWLCQAGQGKCQQEAALAAPASAGDAGRA